MQRRHPSVLTRTAGGLPAPVYALTPSPPPASCPERQVLLRPRCAAHSTPATRLLPSGPGRPQGTRWQPVLLTGSPGCPRLSPVTGVKDADSHHWALFNHKARILSPYGKVTTAVTSKQLEFTGLGGVSPPRCENHSDTYAQAQLPGVTVSWKQWSLFGSGKCTLHVPAKETAGREGGGASGGAARQDPTAPTAEGRRSPARPPSTHSRGALEPCPPARLMATGPLCEKGRPAVSWESLHY